MIVYKIYSLSNLFCDRYILRFDKSRKNIFDIGTSPRPTPQLLVLRTNSSIDIFLIYEVHLTDCWSMYDAELPIPSEVTSPVLHAVLYYRGLTPIISFMETFETLSIYCKVAVELRILTLKKLPESRPYPDDASKEVSCMPVIGVYWCILIYGLVPCIRREERPGNNREKCFLYLGICIDC